MIDFTLPELGENVTSGEVLRVLVKPGDTLVNDQPVLELETDKATIEVPSSVAGSVKDVKVKPGDKVTVGQAILSVDEGAAAPSRTPPAAKPADQPPPASSPAKGVKRAGADAPEEPAGGDEQHEPQEPPDHEQESAAERVEASGTQEESDAEPAPGAAATGVKQDKVVDISRGARQAAEPPAAPELPAAPAAPSVRRMARELGIDVNQLAGSGPGGRISVDDVKAQAKRLLSEADRGTSGARAAEPLPDFSRWGEVARQPMRAVRRKTAQHVTAAWTTIPHVTQHDLADVTDLETVRKGYAARADAAGGNLTITAIAVKIVATALKVFPQFNASLDAAADEIVYKKYVHIGVAVDTERGLLVPVVRNADTKNIVQISVELAQLSEKARARKISLDELQGGCCTISNLGGIGGTSFTPIVNAPEVAILGISRARMEPRYSDQTGAFVPRLMLPLSLSYDHRVIDGADGIRFLRWVVEAFEQPFLLALQG